MGGQQRDNKRQLDSCDKWYTLLTPGGSAESAAVYIIENNALIQYLYEIFIVKKNQDLGRGLRMVH